MHVAISLTIVPLKQSISLLTTPTFSVHMTGQAFCVELAKKVTVWYWPLPNASSAPTTS